LEQNITIGLDVAKINSCRTIADPACRKIVPNKQFVDNELHFFRVQGDVTAPPSLEAKIARRFCVNLGVKIVLLAPKRI
jgi:hypothetical protein